MTQPRTQAADASQMASGSGIVLIGTVADNGIRTATTWTLSRFLDVPAFGAYALAIAAANIVVFLANLGLHNGMTFFVARHKRSGDPVRMKGSLIAGIVLSLSSGLLFSLGFYLIARYTDLWADQPDAAWAMRFSAAQILPLCLVLTLQGAMRGFGDMRAYATSTVVLALTTLLGLGVGLCLHLSVAALLLVTAAAGGVAALQAGLGVWLRQGRPLTRVPARPAPEFRPVLVYSIPMGLTRFVSFINMWIATLMMGWYASVSDVAHYRIAISLAMIGTVPSMAVLGPLLPMIAEFAHARELERLRGIVRFATRWLLIVETPIYLVLVLLPDLCLRIFGKEYASSSSALLILLIGQLMSVVFTPSANVIPMSGYPLVNLLNGIAALTVNVILCRLLIPSMGLVGGALSSAITLTLWNVWRIIEAWLLVKCNPLDWTMARVAILSIGLALAGYLVAQDQPISLRIATTATAIAVFALGVRLFGRTPGDAEVWTIFRAKLQTRLLGR